MLSGMTDEIKLPFDLIEASINGWGWGGSEGGQAVHVHLSPDSTWQFMVNGWTATRDTVQQSHVHSWQT